MTPADQQRADQILASLRRAIEPFKDYRVAEAAGYKQFLSKVPQEIYHFTNWSNAFAERVLVRSRAADLADVQARAGRLRTRRRDVHRAAEQATQDQLNERVPLSIATWHLHTNLCLPPPGQQVKW